MPTSMTFHRPASHLDEATPRCSDESVREGRVDPHPDSTLAARRDGHVAADQEGEPAEHLLLGQRGFVRDQIAYPVGKHRVVGHAPGSDRSRAITALERQIASVLDRAAPANLLSICGGRPAGG
jgi:hypothetical protein